MWVLIKVFSVVKPDVHREGVINLPSRKNLDRKVAVLAGAIAEELCEQYGDPLDPGVIANLAVSAYHDCANRLTGALKTYSFGPGKSGSPL